MDATESDVTRGSIWPLTLLVVLLITAACGSGEDDGAAAVPEGSEAPSPSDSPDPLPPVIEGSQAADDAAGAVMAGWTPIEVSFRIAEGVSNLPRELTVLQDGALLLRVDRVTDNDDPSFEGGAPIFRSEDGGRVWSQSDVPDQGFLELAGGMAELPDGAVIAVSGGGVAPDPDGRFSRFVLLQSDDGGRAFSEMESEMDSRYRSSVSDLAIRDDTWVILDRERSGFLSEDGGMTWEHIGFSPLGDLLQPLPDGRVLATSDQSVGDPRWRVLEDEGDTWRATPITDGDDLDDRAVGTASIALPGGEVLVALTTRTADDEGQPLLYRSPDGGRRWQRVDLSTIPSLGDGALIADFTVLTDQVVAAGSDPDGRPVLWVSDDAGLAWATVPLPLEQDPSSGRYEASLVEAHDGGVLVVGQLDRTGNQQTFEPRMWRHDGAGLG